RRVARLIEHVLIAEPDRMPQQLVADEAAVHERVLHVGLRARERRRREPAAQREPFDLVLDVARAVEELAPAELCDPRLLAGAIARGGQSEHDFAIALQSELDVEMPEREAAHERVDVSGFRAAGAHELAPRWRIVEEIANLDRRAARMRGGTYVADRAAVDRDPKAAVRGGRARRQHEPGDRADTRQRLAAKPHRYERLEVVQACDLARRVPRHCERQLVGLDPAAVVGDADQPAAAVLDLDLDPARAGVERVLDELLDDGRGPLDDFTGGDLVDQLRRQDTNGHGAHCRGRRRKFVPGTIYREMRAWHELSEKACQARFSRKSVPGTILLAGRDRQHLADANHVRLQAVRAPQRGQADVVALGDLRQR